MLHLHEAIASLTQGNLSVSDYFTKFRDLWDEFYSVIPFSTCDCEQSRAYMEHLDYMKLLQFLHGLNECYEHTSSQIMLTNPYLISMKLMPELLKKKLRN